MKTIKNKIGNETVIYAETFEAEAMEQVVKISNFEAYENETIRIMPDAHAGKGCTVGTTMTITDKVTPNLVGVDIGCGMLSFNIGDDITENKDKLLKIDEKIRTVIPFGNQIQQLIDTNTVQKCFNLFNFLCFTTYLQLLNGSGLVG